MYTLLQIVFVSSITTLIAVTFKEENISDSLTRKHGSIRKLPSISTFNFVLQLVSMLFISRVNNLKYQY